jgi:hypothetical protein
MLPIQGIKNMKSAHNTLLTNDVLKLINNIIPITNKTMCMSSNNCHIPTTICYSFKFKLFTSFLFPDETILAYSM